MPNDLWPGKLYLKINAQWALSVFSWRLASVSSTSEVWFSDGIGISEPRDSNGISHRLIVDQQGFLDLTVISRVSVLLFDANGLILPIRLSNNKLRPIEKHKAMPLCINMSLYVGADGSFEITSVDPRIHKSILSRVSGKLKPLPCISATDIAFIDTMIEKRYIPYQNVPGAPCKTVEELTALGRRLFPFTAHSFQLALCVYDWTTASFARMVLLKIFEYTGIQQPPFPLDLDSLAEQIWASDWGPYTPQDPDYMRSFMMKPAKSLEDVKAQLNQVISDLHELSTVENTVLSAALQSLPRTSIFQYQNLFSGQVDICQLELDHFGVEFLECPLNDSPVCKEFRIPLADVLKTYVSVGKTITTKMAWSFTHNIEDALHYENGILLVATYPEGSRVWDSGAYVTPLSDDPKKIEYVFAPRTVFKVLSVQTHTLKERQLVVITLQPNRSDRAAAAPSLAPRVGRELKTKHVQNLARGRTYSRRTPRSSKKSAGPRCACM
ncbi:hypothetical protein F5Y03DRAFT_383663 [Xylaria venustula]|nr:hypothetical protein F5Y03DRAFT_383663 [Xylaria venustula]